MMRTTGVLLGFAAFLSMGIRPPVAPAQPSPPSGRFADLDAYIGRALQEYRVPGAAVAVAENGQAAFVKGYGVRDAATGAPVDANTVFQLASVSKTFAGVTAGILVDAGRLKWDTPIVAYLPQFATYNPYVTGHMTMRDLLAHRTGWPKFTGDLFNDLGYSSAEVLRRLRYLAPAYSFREVAQYSNLAYFAAGEVIARAAGTSWDRFVRDRVFRPLAMSRSSVSLRALTDANTAKPYAIVDGAVRPTTRTSSDLMPAAGGVNSTAADMAHYLQFLLSGGTYDGKAILKPATIAELYARSMVSDVDFTEMPPISEATGYYYGLGVASYDYADHRIVEKGGALSGFRTLVMLLPDRRAGIVVLSNLNATAFPEAVRAYYLEKSLLGRSPNADLAEIARRNAKLAALFKPETPPANARPFRGSLGNLAGTYENALYGRCTVSVRAATPAIACGPAKYAAPLVHFDGNTFLARWPGATHIGDQVAFTLGPSGKATRFTDDALGTFTRVR